MKWREIKRDKDGFATDESMAEMYAMLPIAVLYKDLFDLDLVYEGNWSDAAATLYCKPFLTHFCTIPELPMMENEES